MSMSRPAGFRMAWLALLLAILWLHAPGVHAEAFLSPDVPFDTYEDRDILRFEDPGFLAYNTNLTGRIPAGVNLTAVGANADDDFLLAVDVPCNLAGDGGDLAVEPGDIVHFDDASDSFDVEVAAGILGLPDGAAVDAVFHVSGASGGHVFSVDVPVTLGAVTYQPHDLLRYDGEAVSLHFDGSEAGLPDRANLVAASGQGPEDLAFCLDVPATLPDVGGVGARDVVHWNGTTFSVALDGDAAGAPDGAAFDAYLEGTPTHVVLCSFTARFREGEGVLLRWETRTETGAAGFHLWRRQGMEGEEERITPEPVPARGGATCGAVYEVLDTGVEPEELYAYRLEVLEEAGASNLVGPVPVLTVPAGTPWEAAGAEGATLPPSARGRGSDAAVLVFLLGLPGLFLWLRKARARRGGS